MARRKEKNGEKSPWGQCLTRPVPNCRRRSGFWLVPENFCVFLPNLAVLYFSSCHIFRLSLAPTICPWRECYFTVFDYTHFFFKGKNKSSSNCSYFFFRFSIYQRYSTKGIRWTSCLHWGDVWSRWEFFIYLWIKNFYRTNHTFMASSFSNL